MIFDETALRFEELFNFKKMEFLSKNYGNYGRRSAKIEKNYVHGR